MIDAAREETLSIEKLEAMTAVCSVGLDMIVVPGDTSAETISGIIADEGEIKVYDEETGILLLTVDKTNINKYTSSNPFIYETSVKHINTLDFLIQILYYNFIAYSYRRCLWL